METSRRPKQQAAWRSRGAAVIEYIVTVALIAIVALAAVKFFGLTIDKVIMGSKSKLTRESGLIDEQEKQPAEKERTIIIPGQ